MIPVEAVEAAAKAMYAQDGGVGEFNLGVYEDYAQAMLEAAAPYMFSHEREQTRLAHLDAMVNRETKRAELAEAFAYGWREGKGMPTPVNLDSQEILHNEAHQPDWNPYKEG